MRKITAQQIIDNLNAHIKLSRAQNVEPYELQRMLDAICRHNNGFESIEVDTQNTLDNAAKYAS